MSVMVIFVSHIPQTPVHVHKADQFIVIHGGIIDLIEIQCTKTPTTDAGRMKKSNLFERSTGSDDFVRVLTGSLLPL